MGDVIAGVEEDNATVASTHPQPVSIRVYSWLDFFSFYSYDLIGLCQVAL